MLNLLKSKTLIYTIIFLTLFGSIFFYHTNMVNNYEKSINTLSTQINEIRESQIEANKKQDKYIDYIYNETTKLNENINNTLKDNKYEIENWTDTIVSDINAGLRNTITTSIDNSTTKALEDSRTSIRDTAIILNRKFSKQVSRDIVELIGDAERNRVALGKCIEWADTLKETIENPKAIDSENNLFE